MLPVLGLLRTAVGYALPASTGCTLMPAGTRMMAANAWSLFQKEHYPLVREELGAKDQEAIQKRVKEMYNKLTSEEKAAYSCHCPGLKQLPAGSLDWHAYVHKNLTVLWAKLGTKSVLQINKYVQELFPQLPEADRAKYEEAASPPNNTGINLYRKKVTKGIRVQVDAEMGPGADKSQASLEANKRVTDSWHALSAAEKAAYAKEERQEAAAKKARA